ncbi:MAG: NfeD family protein, partial [Anaerolineae bacterium]
MKRLATLILVVGLFVAASVALPAQTTRPVIVLEIEGVINPFSARYLERGLQLAEQRDAQLVIITLDTPG